MCVMKKVRLILMMFAGLMMTASCSDDDKIITEEQLPAPARSYIQKTYPGVTIMFAKEDSELFSTKYKVQLSNRVEIEFDSDGAPVDIEMED